MGVAKNRNTMLSGVLAGAWALGVVAWCEASMTAAAQGPPKPAAAEVAAVVPPMRVVVSIPPLAGLVRLLVEAVAGGHAGVEVLIPAGVSEHGYEPTPLQLAGVATADLVVLVGLGLDGSVERFAADHRSAGSGARGGAVVFAEVMGAEAGDRHPAHEHADGACEHEGTDPHMWLDPRAAKKLVERVRSALAERLAAVGGADVASARAALDAAAARVLGELDALDAEYARELAEYKGRTVVVAHDAYGWLARRYGITFTAIAGLNAGEPTPGAVAKAATAVRTLGLRCVYVEPQMSRAAAERVAAATGTKVRTLDPLGTGDYFAMMRGNLRALVEGFGGAIRD